MNEMKHPITIKIRIEQGCFCEHHSPETNRLINEIMRGHDPREFDYYHHESGPEIIAWLALGTAGLTVTKSLIDLITAIINACKKGKAKNDNQHGKLILIVRDTHRTDSSEEEIVLELYENDTVTSEIVQKAIEKGVGKRFSERRGKSR